MENNDKAKRILFGRTDIGDEKLDSKIEFTTPSPNVYDGEKLKGITIDEHALWETVTEEDKKFYEEYVYWPKEWMDAVIAFCQEQKITPPELLSNYCKYVNQSKLDQEAMELIHKAAEYVKNGTTHLILTYCHDNNCSIQDLIRCHKWAIGRMPIDWKPQD